MTLGSYYQGLRGQLLAQERAPNASTTSEAERLCCRTALAAAIRKSLSRASVALSHGAKRAAHASAGACDGGLDPAMLEFTLN